MNFDDVLVIIGEFGTYQKRLYFLLCLPQINSAFFMLCSVFLLGVPNHRCALPGWNNDTYHVQDSHHLKYLNKTIPPAPSTDDDLTYDPCKIYQLNATYDANNNPINASTYTCDRWVYDDSVFKSTFTSQHNLVCDDKFLPSLAKILFFAGVLAGAFVFGVLSDIIGRKKTLLACLVLVIAASVTLTWANSFPMFVVLRFIVGASNAGVFMTVYVTGMELVGPSKRVWAGIVTDFFPPLGLVILTCLAYLIKDWKYIELAISLPSIPYLSYFWLIPESPRWLMSQGRYDEAEAILRHAAKVNKATLPEKIFERNKKKKTIPKSRLWHLFTSRVMAVRTLVIFLNWTVVSMTYYGLSLNTGNLGGNFYINFLISGLVEFPAFIICLLLLDRVGRKWLLCTTMTGGGLACISTVFTTIYGENEIHLATVALAMVGKLGISAAYGVIYVYSAELYPTILRNAGMGASSCCARIGGILAPYIAGLNHAVSGDLGRALPFVIFGTASVVAGLLSLLLPETLNRQLPETIEDTETFSLTPKVINKQVFFNEGFDVDSATDEAEVELLADIG